MKQLWTLPWTYGSPRPAPPWLSDMTAGSGPLRPTRCTGSPGTRGGTPGAAAVGSGDLVSVEYWRLQVGLSTTSGLRTFTLRRQPLATQWLLVSIDDGS